ncbi:hypothetical protein FDECE_16333 [Fusarium decemcellulare]|nr:hypothetical protein FDECE_16333 [Fusarium decemcellulare]
MHILGLSAGSRYGNSEILLEAALHAAEKSSPNVTTSVIRVPNLRFPRYARPLPSSLLPKAVSSNPDDPGQDDPDDRSKVYDAIMDADAIIISTPVYCHMPPGCLKTLFDTILGPHADISIALDREKMTRAGTKNNSSLKFDPRSVKPRVSGFIVVAGSTDDMPEQWSLGLVSLHQTVYPLQATTVDQAVIKGYGVAGSVLIDKDKTVRRAELLGQRVASQLGRPLGTATYLGPELDGSCPYCHLRVIQLREKDEIECDTKEKPFSCPTCRASFARKDVLMRHQRSHTRNAARSSRPARVITNSNNLSGPDPAFNPHTRTGITGTTDLTAPPLFRSTQPSEGPSSGVAGEFWESSIMTEFPDATNTTLDTLSDARLSSNWVPADDHTNFDVTLGLFPSSTVDALLSAASASNDTVSFSSHDSWRENTRPYSEQTIVSGLLETSSIPNSRADRRVCLVEALHDACATRWCMSDFKRADSSNLADDSSCGGGHRNLTVPLTFLNSVSPNPRFMSSEHLATGIVHLNSIVIWARRLGILRDLKPGRAQPPEGIVADTMAILDNELSSIFAQPPLVKRRPERTRPLASNALFAARTAEEWRDMIQSETNRNGRAATPGPLTGSARSAPADACYDPRIGPQLPDRRKRHWLKRILTIGNLATEISVCRSALGSQNDTLPQQDTLLQRLRDCLPPLFSGQTASREDDIRGTVLIRNSDIVSHENVEANVLWHSTLISLYIDRDALERYHGSEGVQMAQSTYISLSPATTVVLVLHCLLIRCLVEKCSRGGHYLSVFVPRCVLLAGMVLNWYHDQKRGIFSIKSHGNTSGLEEVSNADTARSEPGAIIFEEWTDQLNSANPFVILLQEQATRDELQSMLDAEDVIFNMQMSVQKSNGSQGRYNNFLRCLEILANYEMGLDVFGERTK